MSQKPVTFQDLVLVIRTGFVSQDEENHQKTNKKTPKPQWEIIHRGNHTMDFPDTSPETWLGGTQSTYRGSTAKDNKTGKLSTKVRNTNSQTLCESSKLQ